jgi:hypothetical protein
MPQENTVGDLLKKSMQDFEIALSEFTTSVASAMAKAEKMKLPESCRCAHCVLHLETLEGQTIPMLNGQIAAIRGVINQMRDQIDG